MSSAFYTALKPQVATGMILQVIQLFSDCDDPWFTSIKSSATIFKMINVRCPISKNQISEKVLKSKIQCTEVCRLNLIPYIHSVYNYNNIVYIYNALVHMGPSSCQCIFRFTLSSEFEVSCQYHDMPNMILHLLCIIWCWSM